MPTGMTKIAPSAFVLATNVVPLTTRSGTKAEDKSFLGPFSLAFFQQNRHQAAKHRSATRAAPAAFRTRAQASARDS